jgi:hypothetical protein
MGMGRQGVSEIGECLGDRWRPNSLASICEPFWKRGVIAAMLGV